METSTSYSISKNNKKNALTLLKARNQESKTRKMKNENKKRNIILYIIFLLFLCHDLRVKLVTSAIVCIVFANFTKSNYSFHSPQVQRNLMSKTKKFVYYLSHASPNDLRLGILGSQEILRKSWNFVGTESSAYFPLQNEVLALLNKN